MISLFRIRNVNAVLQFHSNEGKNDKNRRNIHTTTQYTLLNFILQLDTFVLNRTHRMDLRKRKL